MGVHMIGQQLRRNSPAAM